LQSVETPISPLDDPDYAAFAWARYRRILRWMTLVAALAAVAAILILWRKLGWMQIHVAIATFLGVFFTILLGAALMGLMFLSSGSGHDAKIADPLKGEIDLD
jgi:hypothetical protein